MNIMKTDIHGLPNINVTENKIDCPFEQSILIIVCLVIMQ